MILNYNINTDISVNNLMDLNKLKSFEDESNLKVNASELARELGVDRRTIRKYINGYEKTETRKRKTQFDGYYEIIDELLGNDIKIFKYKACFIDTLVTITGLKLLNQVLEDILVQSKNSMITLLTKNTQQ